MRSILLYCLIFCTLNLAAQQSNVNGIVSIHNSETETGKRQYVVNAQVEDDFGRAQPVLTDVSGQFKLIYVGANEGTAVSFRVKKDGLEVVNTSELRAVAGQTEWVKISMAIPEKIAEYRRQIYQVGKTEAEKRLERKVTEASNELARLTKQHVRNNVRINQLMQQLQELDEQRKKIEAQALQLAEKYSPLNLDDVSPLFRQAFKLFQKGALDSSLLLLSGVNLYQMVDNILKERQKVGNLQAEVHSRDSIEKQSTINANTTIKFKADLHATRFEFDSARNLYKLLIKLDTLNFHSYFDYALFVDDLNDKSAALKLYLKAIELIQQADDNRTGDKRKFLAETYNNLGLTYSSLMEYEKAEKAFKKSLDLYTTLAKENPLYEENVATTYSNLAAYYSETLKFDLSEKAHLKALEIFQRIKENNTAQHEFELAKLHINLGHFYWEIKDFNKAGMAYNVALTLLRPLEKKGIDEFQDVWATLQTNIGTNSTQKNQFTDAKNAFLQAYAIYKKLSESNPYAYLKKFSSVCSAMGMLFIKTSDFLQAETYFRKAYIIDTALAHSNPLVYSAGLSYTVNNLASLYLDKNEIAHATAAYNEVLAIYKELNAENMAIFKPQLAHLYGSYGMLYYHAHDYKRAETWYLQCLQLYKEIAADNPQVYQTEISNTQNNLAGLYFDMGDFDKAKMLYKGCVAIRTRMAEQDPFAWLPEVANSLNNLGNLYSSINELDSARQQYEAAVDVYQKLAKDHPEAFAVDLATIQSNLCNFYRLTKDYVHATAASDEAIRTFRQLYKSQPDIFDNDLAKALSNAGIMYQDMTEYTKAEASFKEALDLFKQVAAKNNRQYDKEVAATCNNLGLLYFVTNDLQKAEPVFQQTITIRKQLAKEAPHLYEIGLAQSLMYFGYMYKFNKNYVQADRWLNESSDIWGRHMRENLEQWKLNKRALLELYYTVIDTIPTPTERIPWQQKAFEVSLKYYEASRNEEEPRREFTYASSQLVWYYTLNREFAKAEQFAKKGLSINKTSWLTARLAHTLLLQGKYDDAVGLYEQIKKEKNESGDQFGAICIKELGLLENLGITNKDFNKVRSLLEN